MTTKNKLRSGLEDKLAQVLTNYGIEYLYEPARIPYVRQAHYIPDFVLPNGIIIEAKGWFKSADRTKHKLIKAQWPELDIRFVFQHALSRGENSNITNAEWCKKNGFQWSSGTIPLSWIQEDVNQTSLDKIKELFTRKKPS